MVTFRRWTAEGSCGSIQRMTSLFHRTLPILFVFGLVLSGCVSTPEPVAERDIRFAHLGQQTIAVQSIQVMNAYAAPLRAPNVDHEVAPTPDHVLTTWAGERLRAFGSGATGQFVIETASITQESLATDKGFTGLFKTEQASRFVIRLAARFQIVDVNGAGLASARASVERFQTAPEGQTLNERDELLYNLIETAMTDFDKELMTQLARHAGAYLR